MKTEEQRIKIRAGDRRRYAAHPDKKIQASKKWAQANPNKCAAAGRKWRAANPEVAKERQRQWQKTHPEKAREMRRKCYEAAPEKYRAYGRKKTLKQYGLTPEQFESMKSVQGGACALCRISFSDTPRVDHDHSTGFVRGLLCHTCNTALGGFRDSEDLLQAAIEYLRRSGLAQAVRKIYSQQKQMKENSCQK